jgi:CRP/FNR family cyclic AMP-dependent transcriptional regulator
MTQDRSRDALKGIDIFGSLGDRERGAIAMGCSWRRVAAGHQIIYHGDTTDDIYFLAEGSVRAISYSPEGKEVAYRDIQPGEIFGEYAAIDGGVRSANVYVVTDAFYGSLKGKAFRDVLVAHPTVAIAVMRQLTRQTRALTERIFEFSAYSVQNRIHAELLRLALSFQPTGNSVTVSPFPTHAEFASRIATYREAITREINALARAGIVTKGQGRIVIEDLAALQKLVSAGG